MATMVRLTVALNAASARTSRDLLEALRFLALRHASRAGLPGVFRLVGFRIATVRYVEEWATEADMRRRVRSDRFTSLLAVVESAQEPQVHFDFVTTTRGLDYVDGSSG